MELSGAVDPGGLDQGKGQGGLHVLLHVEIGDRGRNGRNDQRDEVVLQLHFSHQLQEAESRDLGRDHHDRQNKGGHELFQFKIIDMYGVGCHGRKIGTQDRAAA